MSSEKIKIVYHSNEIEKLRYIDGKSDWIDLRSAEDVVMKKGEFRLINLGVTMSLPDGYEMIIAPRSSTFKNFGILQTNSIGVIDEKYGKNSSKDVLMYPALAVRDTEIHINDRICQFRIFEKMPRVEFVRVSKLNDKSRGSFGSTGTK